MQVVTHIFRYYGGQGEEKIELKRGHCFIIILPPVRLRVLIKSISFSYGDMTTLLSPKCAKQTGTTKMKFTFFLKNFQFFKAKKKKKKKITSHIFQMYFHLTDFGVFQKTRTAISCRCCCVYISGTVRMTTAAGLEIS